MKTKAYLIFKDFYNSFSGKYRVYLRNIMKKNTFISHDKNITFKILKKQLQNSNNFFEQFFDLEEIFSYDTLNSDELKMLFNLVTTMEYHALKNRVIDEYI